MVSFFFTLMLCILTSIRELCPQTLFKNTRKHRKTLIFNYFHEIFKKKMEKLVFSCSGVNYQMLVDGCLGFYSWTLKNNDFLFFSLKFHVNNRNQFFSGIFDQRLGVQHPNTGQNTQHFRPQQENLSMRQ